MTEPLDFAVYGTLKAGEVNFTRFSDWGYNVSVTKNVPLMGYELRILNTCLGFPYIAPKSGAITLCDIIHSNSPDQGVYEQFVETLDLFESAYDRTRVTLENGQDVWVYVGGPFIQGRPYTAITSGIF